MELQVRKLQEEHVGECVDLFIDTFSREPWNEVYDSRKQVEGFMLNTERYYPSYQFY